MAGFSSTAIGSGTGNFAKKDTLMKITIPVGSRGISMLGAGSGFGPEREFVLPHNTQFRVDSQTTRPNGTLGTQRVLNVTALPPATSSVRATATPYKSSIPQTAGQKYIADQLKDMFT